MDFGSFSLSFSIFFILRSLILGIVSSMISVTHLTQCSLISSVTHSVSSFFILSSVSFMISSIFSLDILPFLLFLSGVMNSFLMGFKATVTAF